jgi:hypothetical protein
MSKSVVGVAILSILFGGCTAANKQAGYVGGAAMLVGGALLYASGAGKDCQSLHNNDVLGDGTGCDLSSGMSESLGGLTAIVGAAILVAAMAAPDADAEGPQAVAAMQPTTIQPTTIQPTAIQPTTIQPTTIQPSTIQYTMDVPRPLTDDPQLRNFTLQASMAARGGQCSTVQVIARRVEDLDAVYRQNGFLADPVVVACLQ